MTSEWLGEMFEGDFDDTFADIIVLMLIGDKPLNESGARTPMGVRGNYTKIHELTALNKIVTVSCNELILPPL